MPSYVKTIAHNVTTQLLIDRPEVLNALDEALLYELKDIITQLERDPNVRVVVISSSHPKAFVSGADIKQMINNSPFEAKRFTELGCQVFNKISECTKPVIAAINGYSFGGGVELALACDLRIASENSKFGFPETKLGIIPGWGGIFRLPRLIGEARAKELIFTGKTIVANEALSLGLVNEVVKPEDLESRCFEIAQEIAKNAPIALAEVKKWLSTAMSSPDNMAEMISAQSMVNCFASNDQKEGMRAFLEKRVAVFKGE